MSYLASVTYAENKIAKWTETEKKNYVDAYWSGNWELVYSMTEDLDGSQFYNNLCRAEIEWQISNAEYLRLEAKLKELENDYPENA